MDIEQESYRVERISELIKRELAMLFHNNIQDSRIKSIVIIEVIVSKNLNSAKVFFDVDSYNKDIKFALNKAGIFLRKQIAKSLKLRHAPELNFIYDRTQKTANRIDELLAKL